MIIEELDKASHRVTEMSARVYIGSLDKDDATRLDLLLSLMDGVVISNDKQAFRLKGVDHDYEWGIDTGEAFKIRAEAHSDDRKINIEFNANAWFSRASDGEIKELADCDFGGDQAADGVARFFEDFDLKIQDLFHYMHLLRNNKHPPGFECYVNESDAKLWIETHRPILYKELFRKVKL